MKSRQTHVEEQRVADWPGRKFRNREEDFTLIPIIPSRGALLSSSIPSIIKGVSSTRRKESLSSFSSRILRDIFSVFVSRKGREAWRTNGSRKSKDKRILDQRDCRIFWKQSASEYFFVRRIKHVCTQRWKTQLRVGQFFKPKCSRACNIHISKKCRA